MTAPTTIDEVLRQSQAEGIAATKAMFATESDVGYPSLNSLIAADDDATPAERIASFTARMPDEQVAPADVYAALQFGWTPEEISRNLDNAANLMAVLNGVIALHAEVRS